MAHMQPVFKPLLKPHLEDLEKKVAPGLFILTWASMNIDGYLHRFKQVRHVVRTAAMSPWISSSHDGADASIHMLPGQSNCDSCYMFCVLARLCTCIQIFIKLYLCCAGPCTAGGAGAQADGHCGQQGAGQPRHHTCHAACGAAS